MASFLAEIQGWLAFLDRPPVLIQLLPVVALLLALIQLRRQPRRGVWSRLARLPLVVPLLLGQAVLALVLLGLGHRVGLVLLLAQISLAWLLLRLVERQLLARWLPPETVQLLNSRLLRPLFLFGVLLQVLDALVCRTWRPCRWGFGSAVRSGWGIWSTCWWCSICCWWGCAYRPPV